MITLFQAKRRLARSIRNERRNYDQTRYVVRDAPEGVPATCGTACCIAGHIEACWPGTARRLLKQNPGKYPIPACECSACRAAGASLAKIDHATLARDTWLAVTGKPCRFDFGPGPHSELTREDAVAHIYGRHKEWKLRA